MLSSLSQQHTLDISMLQSKIRELESSLFDAEAQNHALQKQIATLQEQAPLIAQPPVSDSRRPSAHGHHPDKIQPQRVTPKTVPTPRAVLDQGLSPEVRRKRKVALSMLKARIDSELAAASALSSPLSRALSPDASGHTHSETEGVGADVRQQFLDESHIFWCHRCTGDLVVL
jgi:hypothetical protein